MAQKKKGCFAYDHDISSISYTSSWRVYEDSTYSETANRNGMCNSMSSKKAQI
jgi:hypothetical protein